MAPVRRLRDHPRVDPIVTVERIDASPEVVIPLVLFAMVVGVLGVAFRRTLMTAVGERAAARVRP